MKTLDRRCRQSGNNTGLDRDNAIVVPGGSNGAKAYAAPAASLDDGLMM